MSAPVSKAHTPVALPLSCDPTGPHSTLRDSTGKGLVYVLPTAHAELIVRAVNSHEQLVALASRVARLNPNAGEIGAGMLVQLVEQARAALAAAGKEQP